MCVYIFVLICLTGEVPALHDGDKEVRRDQMSPSVSVKTKDNMELDTEKCKIMAVTRAASLSLLHTFVYTIGEPSHGASHHRLTHTPTQNIALSALSAAYHKRLRSIVTGHFKEFLFSWILTDNTICKTWSTPIHHKRVFNRSFRFFIDDAFFIVYIGKRVLCSRSNVPALAERILGSAK